MKNLAPIPASIPFGKLDSTSTATVMTATVNGVDELRSGVCMWLMNGVITSAENFTININGLGAKPVYQSQAAASRATTLFDINYTALLIYNADRVDGGCWDYVSSVPTKTSDLTNDSGYITGMYIASYGSSTYAEVLAAYKANKVVYCRASSNSNPGTGSQNRMAFLAYINNSTTPTEFEFQYYRSVNSHSDSQQGDQVYVYKLNSSSTWSVTIREAYTKIAAGSGLSKSYSSGTLTLSSDVLSVNNKTGTVVLGNTDVNAPYGLSVSADLSAAGWYRVVRSVATLTAGTAFAVDFSIGTAYNNTNNSIHKVTLLATYENFTFADEVSKSNAVSIDKIRCTRDGTAFYVDIHYSVATETPVWVNFNVRCRPDYQPKFTAESLQAVADTPSGETVLTTYNFSADKSPGKFGTTTKVTTFPFTATTDGLFSVQIRASEQGRLYANWSGIFICDGYQVAMGYVNATFPVKQGTILPSPTTSNVSASDYYWYPLG